MENELRRIVDAIPGFVWTAAPDGNVDFLNQGGKEVTLTPGQTFYEGPDDVHVVGQCKQYQAGKVPGGPGQGQGRSGAGASAGMNQAKPK